MSSRPWPKNHRLPLHFYADETSVIHLVLRSAIGTRPFVERPGALAWSILLNELERESITLYAACLLPEHLHAIVSPRNKAVPRWVKNFKSYSMQQVRVTCGESIGWRPDYYERILRSEIEFQETARYILDNPVEAGLCADSSDWPWTFVRGA